MNGMNSIELWKQLVSYLKMLSNDEKKGLILDRKQIVKIFQQIRIWHNSRGNKEIWRLNREMIIGKLWEKKEWYMAWCTLYVQVSTYEMIVILITNADLKFNW